MPRRRLRHGRASLGQKLTRTYSKAGDNDPLTPADLALLKALENPD